MSSLKVKLFTALESFLRVPPLLIVDEIFRISFGVSNNANKYYNSGGILSTLQQKTTYIPDRNGATLDEMSKSDRLDSTDNEYLNETVAGVNTLNPTPSPFGPPAVGFLYQFPIIKEIWKTFSENIFEVFNSSSPLTDSPGVAPAQANPSTIVENDAASVTSGTSPGDFHQEYFEFSTAQAAADLMKLAEVLMCIVVFFVAIITFMLATENLVKLYTYLISFIALYGSFIFTPFPTAFALATIPSLVYNLTCRSAIAAMYYICRSWPGGGPIVGGNGFNLTGNTNGAGVRPGRGDAAPVVPTVATTAETNNNFITNSSKLASTTECLLLGMFFVTGAVKIHPLAYFIIVVCLHHPLLRCIPDVYAFLKSSWNETKRVQNEYGLSHLIQVESGRLRVNTVFRLFWVTRAAYDAVSKCCNEPLNLMVRYVMTHGTETFTGVVGLTVTVSAICHQIGECLLYLLYNGANTEADANRFGSISTVLFFILSLQTGLTSLDPEKRLDRLAKNIVLLGTALFHALHQMIAPVLTAFRAFQTLQIRAAVLSCTSFFVSGFLTYYLLRYSTISTWSLAVLALAIEFKIKICISLLISFVVYLSQLVHYPEGLEKFVNSCRRVLPTFMVRFFDHLHDELSHEDVVFYLRSVANVGEFLTGIFLFANAVWIFFFESASAIRAIGMSVHAYFNIWCEAQKGWRVYCQRKTASQKIMSLADATDEQLRSRQDDVCAVCYEEMESAKVTNCNHLFHAVCLRKWLYVQNTCPLCHEVLYREDALDSGTENDAIPPPQPPIPEQPPQQQRQTENPQNAPVERNTQQQPYVANPPHVPSSRRGSRQIITNYNRLQQPSSDENDTEPETQSSSSRRTLNNNTNRRLSPCTGARVEAMRYSVYSSSGDSSSSAGSSSGGGSRTRSRFFDMNSTDSDNEHGNSSSGTEYTVGDGSGDEIWANDYSSSDDDEQPANGQASGGARRHRGNAIGVPLLL